MTNIEFAKLVKDMRAAQNKYFRLRTYEALEQCKNLEKKVDDTVFAILNPTFQMELFTEDPFPKSKIVLVKNGNLSAMKLSKDYIETLYDGIVERFELSEFHGKYELQYHSLEADIMLFRRSLFTNSTEKFEKIFKLLTQ